MEKIGPGLYRDSLNVLHVYPLEILEYLEIPATPQSERDVIYALREIHARRYPRTPFKVVRDA